ncbi:Ig-like domain-containing protein [Thaumasiovibrio subtropicus]|uniref:Ig-like domain-containing protein n=1 Tax=Thaumasiovibrio subtropicus TaxID=1891207 RepID=UPI000B35FAD5|nr:Ig-like domain-containing protein [Thaumasiovibrio subtropicus]
MYRPILMSIPLITVLTACGSSSESPESPVGQNKINFQGIVYDGPMANTDVSIFAGTTLLGTGKTNTDGEYSVDAFISDDQLTKIQDQPITYRAQRENIILFQYGGSTLLEALDNESNNALITNFSTVEYVLADIDKNNFVSKEEWATYLTRDRAVIEPNVIRYGVGLKAIIDYSATLAGFENSTVWLRALLNDTSWEEWYRLNITSYQEAWQTLFNDAWFLEQESARFSDIYVWEGRYDNIVTSEPVEAVLENILLVGFPQKVSLGDSLRPSVLALWSDFSSTDISDTASYSVYPEGALVKNGEYWQVAATGTITLTAEYQSASAQVSFVADVLETTLENIVVTDVDQKVTVGDKLDPRVAALWSNESSTEVTSLVEWSFSPANAMAWNGNQLQVVQPGEVTLTAKYQGATATVSLNADQAVLDSLRLNYDQREQYLQDEFQVQALGVHLNDYLVDFSDQAEWVSSDPEILESLGNGQFRAKKVGTATVTATFNDLQAEQAFDVVPKLTDISLNLPNHTISRAETLQMSLNGSFNDGSVSVITEGVAWTSSNAEILAIDADGVATGVAEGQVEVTATYKGFTLKETVTVIQPKIIAYTPEFVDGVLTMKEGDSFEYGFKFTRSNGVEHVFTAADDGLDFASYGFMGKVDSSGIGIAEIDEDNSRMRAVRSGEDKLQIDNVPVALQQIFVELGAISSANDYPSKVVLNVNVLDNLDVYQWNAIAGEAPADGTANLVQAIQNDDTLYRFWQVSGAEQDGIYLSTLTSEGESASTLVVADTQDGHKLLNNGIIDGSNGYVLLLTDNGNPASGQQQVNYRFNLSDGSLTAIDMSGFRDGKFNLTYDSFAFNSTGSLIVSRSDSGVTPYVFDFAAGTWEEKALMAGVRIQTPANKTHIATLDAENMNFGSYQPPLLSMLNLETLEITTQEFVMPGDAEHFCRSVETLGIAVEAALRDSGAGCLVSQKGSYDGIGYWLWDSIADLPKLHLFADGYVQSTTDVYAVASRKLDGHVLFGAARIKDANGNDAHEVAEIVDVEVDGTIEQQIRHQRFAKQGEVLNGEYSKNTRLLDGTQFVLDNVNVPNEVFAVFNQGVAVRNQDGVWTSDKYMYQLPVKVDTSWKLYNLGNTLVLSQEDSTDPKYWLLQMREPQPELFDDSL